MPLHLTVGRSSSLKTPGAGNSNDSWLNWINFHNFWISFHPLHFFWIRFHPAKLDQFASFSHYNLDPETWISSQFVDLICDSNFQAISAAEVLKGLFTNWTPIQFSFEPNWIGIQKTYRTLIQQLIRHSPGPVKHIQELQRTESINYFVSRITWVWISRTSSL